MLIKGIFSTELSLLTEYGRLKDDGPGALRGNANGELIASRLAEHKMGEHR